MRICCRRKRRDKSDGDKTWRPSVESPTGRVALARRYGLWRWKCGWSFALGGGLAAAASCGRGIEKSGKGKSLTVPSPAGFRRTGTTLLPPQQPGNILACATNRIAKPAPPRRVKKGILALVNSGHFDFCFAGGSPHHTSEWVGSQTFLTIVS